MEDGEPTGQKEVRHEKFGDPKERFAEVWVQREVAIDAHGERLEEEGEEAVLRLGRACVLEREADERRGVVLLAGATNTSPSR